MTIKKQNKKILLFFLIVLFIFACLANLGNGSVNISLSEAFQIIAQKIGQTSPESVNESKSIVLFSIRIPRILLGCLVGGTLAICGACLQSLFRNPLADPGLIGVSAGASLGAIIGIYFNTFFFKINTIQSSFLISFLAFVCGLIVSIAIFKISTKDGKPSVAKMLLCGIAANSLVGAAIGFFTYMSSDSKLREIAMWGMGNLGEATWQKLGICFLVCSLSCLILLKQSNLLNIFLLGEKEAQNLGVNTTVLKKNIVVFTALAVAVCVSFAGPIGFVGLVIPHIIRMLVGPDNRVLIPFSFLLGSSLLSLADLASRTIAIPSEIPIGVITSMIGAPIFLYLLVKEKERIFQ